MAEFIDLTGMKFEKWTVLERVQNDKHGQPRWLCECDCELKTQREVSGNSLKKGDSKSCGCFDGSVKHGMSKTRIYRIYKGMINRCTNQNLKEYKDYGGRGIFVCEEWITDFLKFYTWSIENGYEDNLSIDRKENDKGYNPSNCRWTTLKEQNNNTRKNVYLEINGETHTVAQWAELSSILPDLIYQRLKIGWSGSDLLKPSTKVRSVKQSGIEGINWSKNSNKWQVRDRNDNKVVNLGYYKELEDAIRAKEEYIKNKVI